METGMAKTYRASTIVPLVIAVTASRTFWNIIGSATRKVSVKRIEVSGMNLTAVQYVAINVVKYSSATSGGTSTTLVAVPLNTAPVITATAVSKAYTAVATDGTLIGTVASWYAEAEATTAAAAGVTADHVFTFGDIPGSEPIVLNGVAEELAMVLPITGGSAMTMAISVEWTEEIIPA